MQGGEAGADYADAEFDLRPEHVARVGPGCVDVVDVGYGPAADDGGGAGTGLERLLSVGGDYRAVGWPVGGTVVLIR